MSDPPDNNPNRTVFRPSPLQGLRTGQGQPEAAAPPPGATNFDPPPSAPPPPSRPAARLADDDFPNPPPGLRPRNPLMTAAAPILALIAAVRAGRARVPLPQLHQQVSAAVVGFSQAIAAAGYRDEAMQRARYAVCATIDDIAQNLPGQPADGAEWARRSLVVQTFQENIGGDRFWQLLDDMLARPAEFVDLIELYHACLAAGFEGRYRVMPDGKSRLREIITGAYAALPHARNVSPIEMAPHWRGSPSPMRKVGFWTPLAVAAAGALLLLLAIYLVLRLILAQTGQPALQALRSVNPEQPLRLSRAAPVAAPPVGAQLIRLRQFLAPEIAQGLVRVEQDAKSIRVRTTVGQLFSSGSDQLESGRRQLFERIGAAVETEPGDVRIEGHADSDRVFSLSFPDNVVLSRARADTVAGIIRGQLSKPNRVSAEGFGDTQPIAPNTTAQGKSLNRRVEIVIPRHE